eukprot:EW705997.1.p1 GENE.EW705997.1~~EW705997.1.p1  ORF type:complete len:103 (-),score=2.13 EW705997.1:104-412(-)
MEIRQKKRNRRDGTEPAVGAGASASKSNDGMGGARVAGLRTELLRPESGVHSYGAMGCGGRWCCVGVNEHGRRCAVVGAEMVDAACGNDGPYVALRVATTAL